MKKSRTIGKIVVVKKEETEWTSHGKERKNVRRYKKRSLRILRNVK